MDQKQLKLNIKSKISPLEGPKTNPTEPKSKRSRKYKRIVSISNSIQ